MFCLGHPDFRYAFDLNKYCNARTIACTLSNSEFKGSLNTAEFRLRRELAADDLRKLVNR